MVKIYYVAQKWLDILKISLVLHRIDDLKPQAAERWDLLDEGYINAKRRDRKQLRNENAALPIDLTIK